MTTTVPNGCRHCGIAERPHARQWTEEAGWHSWTQPTTGQIKDRMRARGTAPTKTTPGTPAPEPIYCGMCLYGSDVGVPGHDGKGPAHINPDCPDHNPDPAAPAEPEESPCRTTPSLVWPPSQLWPPSRSGTGSAAGTPDYGS